MKTIKDCVYNLNTTEFCNAGKKSSVWKNTLSSDVNRFRYGIWYSFHDSRKNKSVVFFKNYDIIKMKTSFFPIFQTFIQKILRFDAPFDLLVSMLDFVFKYKNGFV